MRRDRRGVLARRLAGPDQVLLSYHGLDGRTRRTRLTFDPPPAKLAVNAASYQLRVAPGAVQPLFVAVGCDRVRVRARSRLIAPAQNYPCRSARRDT